MLTVEMFDFESIHTYLPEEHLRRALSSLCCFGPLCYLQYFRGLVYLRIELTIGWKHT